MPAEAPLVAADPAPHAATTGARGHHRVLTLDHVWLAATLTFAWVVGVVLAADQTDYWWTVRLGELLLASGQLPAADPLAWTSTREPYVEQQWLAQIILALTHRLGGLEAALVLRGVLQVLTSGLLYLACRRLGASAAAAALACGLALLSIVGGAAIRPQLLALPLFMLFLLGTTVWRGRRWTLLALPLGMVVWANLHGSFPIGVALVGIALAGRAIELWQTGGASNPSTAANGGAVGTLAAAPGRWTADGELRVLAGLLGLCLLAPLANPYGLGIVPWLVDYLTFNTGGTGLATLSTEWLPTSLSTAHGTLFFLSVLLLAIVLVRVGPPAPADCLRLLAFAALALQAVRSTLWWALVMAPVLAWGITRFARGRDLPPLPHEGRGECAADRVGLPAANAVLIGGFAVVALLALPWLRPAGLLFPPERWPVQDPALPVGAAEFAATLPATRLYNHLDWGGYLAWRLAPRQQIFVDGRFQLYPPALYRDYFQVATAAPGWQERLAAHSVEALVLSRARQASLLRALADDGGWQAVYCDEHAAVYLPRAAATIRSLPYPPVERGGAAGAEAPAPRSVAFGGQAAGSGWLLPSLGPRRDADGGSPAPLGTRYAAGRVSPHRPGTEDCARQTGQDHGRG